MKLKKLTFWFSLVVLIALSANAIFLLMIRQSYEDVVLVQQHRQESMALAVTLQQETEQLTSLVRSYTSTGETRYLTYYYDILAIRQGDKPRPSQYDSGAYWDMVVAGDLPHSMADVGERSSFTNRMKSMGSTETELSALNTVYAATEAMRQIEQVAFAATQGLYDPKTEEFVSDGIPQRVFASQLLQSQKYNQRKSALAKAVMGLATMVDARTNTAVLQASRDLERWILLTFGNVVFTFVMVLVASRAIRSRVLQPIETLSDAARRLGQGDYSTRTGVNDESQSKSEQHFGKHGVEELIALGATFDGMAASIELDLQLRQQAQQELEMANQKVEEATRAKSMFLANMSHEIRTPMNAIIGMAYLALKTDLTTRQRDYITKVHQAAKSLLGIINDILDFSKVEAGQMQLEKARFVLEEVVGSSLSLLRQRAHENEIELLFDITDPDLLGEHGALLGDALRLGQVLTNLLSNAVKFTHQGYVKLSVGVDERTDNDVVLRFTLRDTGIGMSEQEIGRLFQEFTQADGSTTRKYGGTGLGLTISKKFVELMDGHIWVESTPGEGSSFLFTARFPVVKPAPYAPAVLPGADVLRVLVVDDQPEARMVLVDLLTALGVGNVHAQPIDCAANGPQALGMIGTALDAGRPYDLVLLDWVMPGMDGGALLQALHNGNLAAQPLSVVVSAYDSDVMHEAADRLGVRHFLPKPVLPEALRHLLNTLTGNQNPLRDIEDIRQSPTSLSGMRVLLVEDNPINQQLAVELMESRGVQVTLANNGQEALDQLHAVDPGYFHLVCMDLQMPVMDGYEATRRLRADPRYAALPVVAMTAHAMVEERERCAGLGMNSHLSKPIEPDDLYATLAHHHPDLTRSAAVSAAVASPAPAADETADAAFPPIAGLDTAGGLRRAGKKPALYRQLLLGFVSHYSDVGERLAAQVALGQWAEAELVAHSIKGLAGTLGANLLVLPAGQLEAACKAQQIAPATDALTALTQQLTPLLAALQQHFSNTGAVTERALPEAPSNALPACLPRLRQLLAEGDSDAVDLWEEQRKLFAPALSAQAMHRIGTALENFEFDAALALLADLPEADAVALVTDDEDQA